MTGAEIAAAITGGAQLAIKILELIQAAQKGDVAAAEALNSLTEHSDGMKAAADEAHRYLDSKFDTPRKP